MSAEPTWQMYLRDMAEFASVVLEYTEGLDQQGLLASRMRWDATLRNLELIGETATHIPEDFRAAHPQIPWRKIVALRSAIIHGHLGVDSDVIWSVIRDDVPALRDALAKVLDPL